MGPDSDQISVTASNRSKLCLEVRRIATLQASWQHVRASGLSSANEDIQKATRKFEARAVENLRTIQHDLRTQDFKFAPQKGIAKKRPKKSPRPIVISPIANKIVQRAILTVCSEIPAIKAVLETPTSFGGIAGPDAAISLVIERIRSGANWFIRSDIPNFFTGISKPITNEFILQSTLDKQFSDLFNNAMTVELENAQALQMQDLYRYFPTGPIGVAQGSSLSPLVGNILLQPFDVAMNSSGITCVRYIDDFLILGKKNLRSTRHLSPQGRGS